MAQTLRMIPERACVKASPGVKKYSDCPIAPPKGALSRIVPASAGASSKRQLQTFTASNYWSASENSTTNSWYVNFNNGTTNNNTKTNTNYVRCVRE